jgi:hypothetical protein
MNTDLSRGEKKKIVYHKERREHKERRGIFHHGWDKDKSGKSETGRGLEPQMAADQRRPKNLKGENKGGCLATKRERKENPGWGKEESQAGSGPFNDFSHGWPGCQE